MKKKKIILAFSGGLDTSFCAVYLSALSNCEVHAVTVNTGGFTDDELKQLEQRALQLGCSTFTLLQEKDNYYQHCVRFLIFGNVLRNSTYPLSVSAERVQQALAIARFAKTEGADAVAHGSTGAGNDQVRFDMIFQQIIPGLEIITPIRDLKLSREQEIEFLQKHGVKLNFEKAKYSINKGMWGTSVGGKETLTSHLPLPEEAYPTVVTKTASQKVSIQFKNGEPIAIDECMFNSSVEAIDYLAQLAGPFGIGRDVHVGDTIIGIKGRVGFEAAAPLLLIKAHHLLEKHTLGKWQLFLKEQIAAWYGTWLHEGQFLDPVMRDIEQFFISTQQRVSGTVYVTLHPHRFTIDGCSSPNDLMQTRFGTYGEMNTGWTGEDVKGFTRMFGNSVGIYHQIPEPVEFKR